MPTTATPSPADRLDAIDRRLDGLEENLERLGRIAEKAAQIAELHETIDARLERIEQAVVQDPDDA